MKCEIKEKIIIIKQDSLDIYDAPILKEKITALATAGAFGSKKSIIIDLQNVDDISTPAIQVLIAAKKGLEDLKILNIKESVINNLILLGVSL